jgi:hypothetical protein
MLGTLAVLALLLAADTPDQPFTQDGVPPVDAREIAEAVPAGGEIIGAAPKALDLGAYKLFAPQPKPADLVAAARFDTTVDVLARAPREPNEAMAEWWRHWNFQTSVYGHGINIQQPMNGGFNILPLIEWIRKKAKEHEENTRAPIDLEPSQ